MRALTILAVLTVAVPMPALAATVSWVRLPAEQLPAVPLLGLQPLRMTDYGSFVWLELGGDDLQRLRTSGTPFTGEPTAGTVALPGFRFDPLQDGEPLLAAQLTSSTGEPGLRLVQLTGPPRRAWIEQLARSGLRILQYYPHNTYLVWDPGSPTKRLDSTPFVRWYGSFHPAYRIDPALLAATGPVGSVELLLFDDGRLDAALADLETAGARITHRSPARPDHSCWYLVAELDGSGTAVAELSSIPTVIWVGRLPAPPLPGDEMSAAIVAGRHSEGIPQPGYRHWLDQLGYDGSGIIWSVVDSGVDPDHPDLQLAGGYSHGPCTTIPGDEPVSGNFMGHGTAVAGLLAGTAATGISDEQGFLLGLGVAPGAEIYSQTMCFNSNYPPPAGWQEYGRIAVAAGASGCNCSWRWGTEYYGPVAQILDLVARDAVFDTQQIAEPQILVFIAGNEGAQPDTRYATAEAKNVIVVGASENRRAAIWQGFELGNIDEIASYSTRGPARDGRILPTVVAPGDGTYTTLNDRGGEAGAINLFGEPSGYYGLFAGTSAAAPHVSGALAVICEWWRDTRGGRDPSPAMARALLVNSAVDISGAPPIPNNQEGWGRIDLGRAIRPGVARLLVDQQQLLTDTGESRSFRVTAGDRSQPLKVTLAWTDPPAAVGAIPALVNDLDLRVSVSDRVYYGNVFTQQIGGGWSVGGGSPDRLHNLENVYLQQPIAAGTITITVEAARLAGDGVPYNGVLVDQDFALVCSNCVELGPRPRRPGARIAATRSRGVRNASSVRASCLEALPQVP